MARIFSFFLALTVLISSCTNDQSRDQSSNKSPDSNKSTLVYDDANFNYKVEEFADVKILKYKIEGWDNLSEKQQQLCYYLTQAGLAGRDITFDQNNAFNLRLRAAFENIYVNFEGDRETSEWKSFETYLKRFWFSNGIHHHYSYKKFQPGFTNDYLSNIAEQTGTDFSSELMDVVFNQEREAKKVNKAEGADLAAESANNFYENIGMAEAEKYYEDMPFPDPDRPISKGLNSKLIKDNDQIIEKTYKVGGMYSGAIEKIVYWLRKAKSVAENETQAKGFDLLIQYYETGDLAIWDEYNIEWIKDTEGDIDYINGFIEVYDDALGRKATFESVVQLKDFDASARMAVLDENIQWFEDNAPIMEQHKKPNVTGVTYKVVQVVGEAGATSPSSPIGINLPNSSWIRKMGSKSVSLSSIISAYDEAAGTGMLEEFCYNQELVDRYVKHGALAGKLHTALHEVVGHASGQEEPQIKDYKAYLKNYASTMEEARADLVALYYIMDPKLIELGLIETLEVGKAEYDSYIRNGLQMQLRRLELGDNIEEDHMRNRQLVAKWVYEKGKEENVIERKEKDGRTYFVVNDYDKLRILFGDLLKEMQRIKSQGDFEACKELVENFGVKVDADLHAEVLERVKPLAAAPYSGFLNPILSADLDEQGNASNIRLGYMNDFAEQMLYYSESYSFLPVVN
ncbi:MAG: dihydrofolate reductase [Bacteroidota bacterium]